MLITEIEHECVKIDVKSIKSKRRWDTGDFLEAHTLLGILLMLRCVVFISVWLSCRVWVAFIDVHCNVEVVNAPATHGIANDVAASTKHNDIIIDFR